jgi:hypothetical protein
MEFRSVVKIVELGDIFLGDIFLNKIRTRFRANDQ